MRKGIGLQKKLAERNDADCHNGRRCAERRTIRDVVGCRRGRTTALKRPGAGRPCRRRAPWPSSGSFREAKARKAGAVRAARSDPAGCDRAACAALLGDMARGPRRQRA